MPGPERIFVGLPRTVFCRKTKADGRKKGCRRRVLLRRNKLPYDFFYSLTFGFIEKKHEHDVLNFSPENPTAQKQSINPARIPQGLHHTDTNNTILSEAVTSRDRPYMPTLSALTGNIGLAIPAGRDIKLVCFLGKLAHARDRFQNHGGNRHLELKRSQKIVHASNG